MAIQLENDIEDQITKCLKLLKYSLGNDLLGVYLYGSIIVGGLQKYSDIDFFVVTNRSTTHKEKETVIANLQEISGLYKSDSKRPIEMTIVVKSEINPWHYPAKIDFQYGEWLRQEFENGKIEPWPTNIMPDLAIQITQVLLASKKLLGPDPNQLISAIPYQDFIHATLESLDSLIADINWDTCNVLLTLARIWSTVETDQIFSKQDAATWVIDFLPEAFQPVMKRAREVHTGKDKDQWDDIKLLIQPCAKFMKSQINEQISLLKLSNYVNKSILPCKTSSILPFKNNLG
jgi:predicted nucleotidyltransferase